MPSVTSGWSPSLSIWSILCNDSIGISDLVRFLSQETIATLFKGLIGRCALFFFILSCFDFNTFLSGIVVAVLFYLSILSAVQRDTFPPRITLLLFTRWGPFLEYFASFFDSVDDIIRLGCLSFLYFLRITKNILEGRAFWVSFFLSFSTTSPLYLDPLHSYFSFVSTY